MNFLPYIIISALFAAQLANAATNNTQYLPEKNQEIRETGKTIDGFAIKIRISYGLPNECASTMHPEPDVAALCTDVGSIAREVALPNCAQGQAVNTFKLFQANAKQDVEISCADKSCAELEKFKNDYLNRPTVNLCMGACRLRNGVPGVLVNGQTRSAEMIYDDEIKQDTFCINIKPLELNTFKKIFHSEAYEVDFLPAQPRCPKNFRLKNGLCFGRTWRN